LVEEGAEDGKAVGVFVLHGGFHVFSDCRDIGISIWGGRSGMNESLPDLEQHRGSCGGSCGIAATAISEP
jgi:hypothetical protein